jgi:putative ATP-binding cassette transporter
MNLIRFLYRTSRKVTLIIAIAGLTSGLCSAGLVALINASLHGEESFAKLAVLGLLAVAGAKIAAGAISQWLLVSYTQATILSLGVDICRKALAASFHHLESTGTHRILTALTTDVPVLANAVQAIPTMAINAAVVGGCGVYLAILYPMGFLALLVVTALGVGIYSFLHSTAFRAIYQSREHRDHLINHFKNLISGIKELKMHKVRGDEFLSRKVEATADQVRQYSIIAARKYVVLDAWNQMLFYLMVAGALFFFPRNDPESSEILTGYIFAALFVMTPIWSIIGSIPVFLAGGVSLSKIDELGISLEAHGNPPLDMPPLQERPNLELRNVEFDYSGGAELERFPFHLGPIDLTFHAGELVFVVGGNGSGKSTLVKLLSGLYAPSAGEIALGGASVTDTTRDWYREHCSVVFSDFHLFDELLGAFGADVDTLSNEYLRKLELDHKVTVSERAFSTTSLSQGQRKRLALLTALIEERPINIFDEWAADQDPHYKQIFYTTLLPELQAKGKIVIVVTHDDRYFDSGDRVIKLEDGKIARRTD